MSESQHVAVDNLERLCIHFLSAGDFDSSSLGRSEEKFSALLQLVTELPSSDPLGPVDVDRLLGRLALHLHDVWDPYSKPPSDVPVHPEPGNAPPAQAPSAELGSVLTSDRVPSGSVDVQGSGFLTDPVHLAPSGGLTCKPVIADRVKWTLPPSFDPIPYLTDPLVRASYIDPLALRKPPHEWPPAVKSKVFCSRTELLRLAAKWDSFGALALIPVSDVPVEERVGCFCVPKDSQYDRFIINPGVANARTLPYNNFTKQLAPGCLLTLMSLPSEDHMVRFSCDDLSEMYFTFLIPPSRAKRNAIGVEFRADEVSHFDAFQSAAHGSSKYLVALNTLAMGGCHAVEYAQQAHHNLLRTVAHCMRDSERVAYRRPCPRSDTWELLAIDDHMVAQVCTKQQYLDSVPLRDTQIFESADSAYPAVGLVQHPKKKRRAVPSGIFLGADVDGLAGLVSAPRHRLGVLIWITGIIARRGTCSAALLATVLGLWVHALNQVFADSRKLPASRVFQLHRDSVNELQAISWIAPLLVSDLRTTYAEALCAMDASPEGAGLSSAPLPGNVVKELWRFSEQKGFYTRLVGCATATLLELGLESMTDLGAPVEAFDSAFPLRPALAEGILFDCVELFAGEGNWSSAHRAAGLRVHGGVDLKGASGRFMDLSDDSCFHEVCALALRRVVAEWHAGPPCLTFGTLRRPRLRSKLQPFGFDPNDPLTALHNKLAMRVAFLFCIAATLGQYFSVEQPGSSVMFYLHCFLSLAKLGAALTRFCCCSFGAPYMKPMRWLHNKPWLLELAGSCTCNKSSPHFVIQGTFTKQSVADFDARCSPSALQVFGRVPVAGEPVARFSGSYPLALVRRMAAGSLDAHLGSSKVLPLSAKHAALTSLGCGLDPLPEFPSVFPESRAFFDDPEWIGELADSLPFSEVLRYKFKRSGHINVLETRAYKTWIKWCASRRPNSRVWA